MIVRSFLTIFSLFALLMAGSACGQVDAGQIRAAADEFLAGHGKQLAEQYGGTTRIETSIDRLDNRLSMPDCDSPLQSELKSTRTIGRVNIQVRCEGNSPWTLYVPAEVRLFRPVAVLTHPVARGDKLTADDLDLRETDISQLSGSYFTEIEEVVDMEAKRLLAADRPILASQLKPPLVINKGDAVILTASGPGLMVKMPGVALADGYRGEQISVRNNQSDRVVEALVTGPGQVKVPM